jgi:hypothetical protein
VRCLKAVMYYIELLDEGIISSEIILPWNVILADIIIICMLNS